MPATAVHQPVHRGRTRVSTHTSSIKLIADLSEFEVSECSSLTLPRGEMRASLLRVRGYMRPEVRNYWCLRALTTDSVILLRDREHTLVAWALIKCANPHVRPTAYLFVAAPHRRRGLGSRLLCEVQEHWPNAEFCPWDKVSCFFFEAHIERVPTALSEIEKWRQKQSAIDAAGGGRIDSYGCRVPITHIENEQTRLKSSQLLS
jgi:GNAT superfamily N-acetyltransferase